MQEQNPKMIVHDENTMSMIECTTRIAVEVQVQAQDRVMDHHPVTDKELMIIMKRIMIEETNMNMIVAINTMMITKTMAIHPLEAEVMANHREIEEHHPHRHTILAAQHHDHHADLEDIHQADELEGHQMVIKLRI
jgi:hypothetical protein